MIAFCVFVMFEIEILAKSEYLLNNQEVGGKSFVAGIGDGP